MKYAWILIAAAGLIVVLAFAYRHQSRGVSTQLKSGAHPMAPEFSVATIEGQKLDLASYRGKVVLLDFWATWCGPCRQEIPQFVRLQDRYRESGLQIIGISMDDGPDPVRQFYQEFHINYPVALGGARLGELYGGVLGLPIAFLIARDGHIYAKHVGAMEISVIEHEIADLLADKS